MERNDGMKPFNPVCFQCGIIPGKGKFKEENSSEYSSEFDADAVEWGIGTFFFASSLKLARARSWFLSAARWLVSASIDRLWALVYLRDNQCDNQ